MKTYHQKHKKRQWSPQENNLLKELYPTFSSKKWKKISQIFKEKGFNRSQLQIRQRWTNFQDPSILFTQWSEEELQTLYKNYNKFGSKWCFIKKTIPGRTENKIKNKFYGNIRIYLRFVVNYFNVEKEDTMWIHKINPSILNDIYKGNKDFSQFRNQMEVAIYEMGYNIDKIRLLSRIQNKEQQYRSLYNKMIVLYRSMNDRSENLSQNSKKQDLRLSEINYGQSIQQESQRDEKKEINAEREDILPGGVESMNSVVSLWNRHNEVGSNIQHRVEMYPSQHALFNLGNVYPYFNCWFYPN